MNFKFLGTGSAFTIDNYHTNFLIERNDKHLLIDAGTDIRFSLRKRDYSYKDIDAVYLSHLHSDHIGGLEYLAFASYFDPTIEDKIQLFGNNKLLRKAWDHTLRGGLESLQGKVLTLNDYFDVNMIRDNGSFMWQDIKFELVQTIHIMNGYSLVPSYGLMIHDPDTNKKIFFTGDTQFAPNQMMDFYKSADYIIQDCETTPYKSGVHAHFSELSNLPKEIKERMYLVHFQDNVIKNSEEWITKANKNDFICGFVSVSIGSNVTLK